LRRPSVRRHLLITSCRSFVSDLQVSAEFCQRPLLRWKWRPRWTPESRDGPSGGKRERDGYQQEGRECCVEAVDEPEVDQGAEERRCQRLVAGQGQGQEVAVGGEVSGYAPRTRPGASAVARRPQPGLRRTRLDIVRWRDIVWLDSIWSSP